MTNLVAAIVWTGIVIHHSATPTTTTTASIKTNHVEVRGWDDIGYHYIIPTNGVVEKGRSLTKYGAHAKGNKWTKGRNKTHIGICLIGQDEFTKEQTNSLIRLVNRLSLAYPLDSVERHHEKCPGKGFDVENLEWYIVPHTKWDLLRNINTGELKVKTRKAVLHPLKEPH